MTNPSLMTSKEELFGNLDALDENDNIFRQYFVEVPVFRKMNGATKFLFLVGEKGTGKSALMKMCMILDKEKGDIVVNIQRPQVDESLPINDKINQWKNILARAIFEAVQQNVSLKGSKLGNIVSIVEGMASDVVKKKYNIDYIKVKSQLLDVFSQDFNVGIYVDDLDTGYRGTKEQNESIIALFTASREIIRENMRLKIRMTLRNDVYYNVRNTDESADKIQNAKIQLSITNHEILYMLTKRVMNYLGTDISDRNKENITQQEMMELMRDIFEPIFYGRGKWKEKPMQYILMTMTRRRPRDLFVLCGLAWDSAVKNGRTKITSADIQENFNEYSNERLRDTISEYHHEFASEDDLRELVLALKPSTKHKHGESIFKKNELIEKIKKVTQRHKFKMNGKKVTTEMDLAKFLYKANVIIGRIDEDEGIRRIYYIEEPNLITKLGDGNYRFEIHPAYRWAIDMLQQNDLLDEIDFEDA